MPAASEKAEVRTSLLTLKRNGAKPIRDIYANGRSDCKMLSDCVKRFKNCHAIMKAHYIIKRCFSMNAQLSIYMYMYMYVYTPYSYRTPK